MTVVELTGTRLGKPVLSDGSGGRKGGMTFTVDGEHKIAPWGDVDKDQRVAFIAKAIRQIESRYGIDGWYWNRNRGPSSEPVSKSGAGAKPRPLWSLCVEFSGDPWYRDAQCGRPILEEGAPACGLHVAAQRRSDESMNRHRERWAAVDERRRIATALTGDLRELWEMACDLYGVEPERRGDARVTESQQAQVDNEVLQHLLRTLIERA